MTDTRRRVDGTILAELWGMVRLREGTRFTVVLAVFLIAGAHRSQLRAETPDKTRAQSPTVIGQAGDPLTDVPPNLRVPRDLRPLLAQALKRSPTLQRQLQTLLHTQRVRMSVSYGGLRGMRLFQAHSTVTHHEFGALIVDTTLFAPADMVELLAHEIEHVCEQIEGVDLKALAQRHDSGVYDVGGHYETQRAIAAGHRVGREIRGLSSGDEEMTHVTY
jgi:hypothetical protein